MEPIAIGELARGVLAEVAPAELVGFDDVARAYADAPWAVRRAARASDPPTATAPAPPGASRTTIALTVTVTLARNLRAGGTPRTPPWWHPHRWWPRAPALDDAVPPVAEADVEALRAAARSEVRAHAGADDELATSMAWAIARDWPRLP